MRKCLIGLVAVVAFAAVVAQPAAAQTRFDVGSMDLGLTAGFGGMDDAPVAGGFKAERGITKLGTRTIGIQFQADYHTFGFGFLGARWNFYDLGLAATYHFMDGEGKFDPFLSAGGGYSWAQCTGPKLVFRDCSGYENEAFVIGRIGTRYAFTEKTWAYADAGAGVSVVAVGIMIRIR